MKNLLKAAVLVALLLECSGCAVVLIGDLLPRKKPLQELVVTPAERWMTRDKVLLLPISGVLTNRSGGDWGKQENPVALLKESLEKAEKDPHVRAILLSVNSPGGEVDACDIMYHELEGFKERSQKIIVAQLMGVAASGGYYVALAADHILAHPTSITGSIGVIGYFPKLEGLTDKLGVEVRTIKSGSRKDLGSLWRGFAPEEREILQGIIDEMFHNFLERVKQSRTQLTEEALQQIADGRVFTASQARELGLIDEINYLEDAFGIAKSLAEIEDAHLISYHRPDQYKSNVYDRFPPPSPTVNVNLNLFPSELTHGPVFMYLWSPLD